MKRLFHKNKTGFEPTPFVTDPLPQQPPLVQRSSRSESLARSYHDEHGQPHGIPSPTSFTQYSQSQGNHPSPNSSVQQMGPTYTTASPPVGSHSSRQSPDPQNTLEAGGKALHNQQHAPHHQHNPSHVPGLSASASAKKWFAGLNGKGSGYDQITPFTMPDQPQNQQTSSTSIDRHSWHDPTSQKPQRQVNKYAGLEGTLGQPGGRVTTHQDVPEGLIPPPVEHGGTNIKRRVSLRDHASGRMFGWTSREKNKEKDKKGSTGQDAVANGSETQSMSVPGPKVITGMRYEDTSYPSSGQPVPVGKDGTAVYSSGRGYGKVHTPTSTNMSRVTTQSADLKAERRDSSGSISRHEHAQYAHQDPMLSPSGGYLPPQLPLSQQQSRSSQQSGRHHYNHAGNGGLPTQSSLGLHPASPGASAQELDRLQRPTSMAKLHSDNWSPASSEQELLIARDQPMSTQGSLGSGLGALASMKSPSGRDAYMPLRSPPPVLGGNIRPASPLHQRIDSPQAGYHASGGQEDDSYHYGSKSQDAHQKFDKLPSKSDASHESASGLHSNFNPLAHPVNSSLPSADQHMDQHGYNARGEESHPGEDGKNHKKKGFFGFVGGVSKDKNSDREKDKQSDWAGFLRKKEPRIEYRGSEYTDHTTITDASYAEVMPTSYAGVNQHVKVMEVPRKDKEQAIREAQERTREAQKAERLRAKEEERRMKDDERRLRDEEKERARLEKETLKNQEKKLKDEEKAAKSIKDPKGVTFEIDELCKTAYAGDLAKIYNIGDKLSRCDKAVHKEAVHATRKQIKHGATSEAKIFALKIWLLISDFDRSDSGFKAISFERKFLSTIEGQLLPTDDEAKLPQAVYERMRDTLSHLCHHYGRLPGGENLRIAWQKVKRSDEPQDGYPFSEAHPVFSPQDPLLRQSTDSRSSQNDLRHLNTILPNEVQQLSQLAEECSSGKSQARALQEALLLEGQHSKKPEIDMLYSACVQAQEQLDSQMSWASAQAEKSRLERGLSTPADFGMSFEDQLNGLHIDLKAGQNDDLPLAERVFVDLLAASDELTNVIKLYDDTERATREHMELRYAQEKSRTDTRMGRSPYDGGLAVPQGNTAFVGTSLSRSPSPSRTFDINHNVRQQDASQGFVRTGARSPYSNGIPLSRTPTTAESADMPPPRFPEDGRSDSPPRNGARLQGPRPFRERGKQGSSASLQSSQHHQANNQQNSLVVRNGAEDDDDDEALSKPPARPSAKALGKRREVPKETSTFDPDDIWKLDDPKRPESPAESDKSFEDWLLRKPETYVYDAMKDKEVQRQLEAARKEKTEPSRRKTLESGYGGSQYISSGMNAQLAEIKKALGNETPSTSPAGSQNSSRAASPIPEHVGLLRAPSSRWKWRK